MRLDRLEQAAGRRRLGPIALGGALALTVILGGVMTFVLVLVILVTVFR